MDTHALRHAGEHSPSIFSSVSISIKAQLSAALLSRRNACIFSSHSSPSLPRTVKRGFVGLCFLLPGQSQVEAPLLPSGPSSVQLELVRLVLRRRPDMEQRLSARLPAYHSPQGVNQQRPACFYCVPRRRQIYERATSSWTWPVLHVQALLQSQNEGLTHSVQFSIKGWKKGKISRNFGTKRMNERTYY